MTAPAARPIRAILIDLDGVVRSWDGVRATWPRDLAVSLDALHSVAFAPDLLPEAITGRITDEEWRAEVARRLRPRYAAAAVDAALAAWSEPAGEVDHDVLALVASWRHHVPVGLITNATSRLPDDLATLGLTESFDVIVNSSAIGVVKPDAGIFRYALEQLDALPDEAIFIDDTAGHIAAARDLRLHVVRFDGDALALATAVERVLGMAPGTHFRKA